MSKIIIIVIMGLIACEPCGRNPSMKATSVNGEFTLVPADDRWFDSVSRRGDSLFFWQQGLFVKSMVDSVSESH